jgi:signal peptidase I
LLIAASLEALVVIAAILATRASVRVVWLMAAAAPFVIALVAADAARIAARPRARFLTRRAVAFACGAFLLMTLGLGFAGDWARQLWGGRPYRCPSGAMFPTLLVGDHFYVDLHAFRRRDPRRGEVVVVEVAKRGRETRPTDLRPELPRESFVKRIVGLPGDRIEFRPEGVYLNGERVPSQPLREEFEDELGRGLRQHEVTLGSHTFRILEDPAHPQPLAAPVTVEEGRYFLLGDNRDHSQDSRHWGTVAQQELVGPVTQIYWSWDFNGSWAQLLDPRVWSDLLSVKTRWDRIGLTVQ